MTSVLAVMAARSMVSCPNHLGECSDRPCVCYMAILFQPGKAVARTPWSLDIPFPSAHHRIHRADGDGAEDCVASATQSNNEPSDGARDKHRVH